MGNGCWARIQTLVRTSDFGITDTPPGIGPPRISDWSISITPHSATNGGVFTRFTVLRGHFHRLRSRVSHIRLFSYIAEASKITTQVQWINTLADPSHPSVSRSVPAEIPLLLPSDNINQHRQISKNALHSSGLVSCERTRLDVRPWNFAESLCLLDTSKTTPASS